MNKIINSEQKFKQYISLDLTNNEWTFLDSWHCSKHFIYLKYNILITRPLNYHVKLSKILGMPEKSMKIYWGLI